MPQREFWTTQHAVGFNFTYRVDPKDPEADALCYFTVKDQEGAVMEQITARVPLNVLHECVADMMRAGWEAYLFGERGHLRSAVAAVLKAWRREAGTRPLWA